MWSSEDLPWIVVLFFEIMKIDFFPIIQTLVMRVFTAASGTSNYLGLDLGTRYKRMGTRIVDLLPEVQPPQRYF